VAEDLKIIINEWRLNGLGIGIAIGIVFEVFLIRSGKGDVRWIVSFLSVLSIGLMGWLSYCIAIDAFPDAEWKAALWTVGAAANTWWTAKFALTGQMFRVFTALILPAKLQKLMEDSDVCRKKE